jgi:hypothetical protein
MGIWVPSYSTSEVLAAWRPKVPDADVSPIANRSEEFPVLQVEAVKLGSGTGLEITPNMERPVGGLAAPVIR